MENLSGITVVLPTLNEEENIKSLIPGIVNVMDKNNIINYEIYKILLNYPPPTIDTISNLSPF